MLFEFYIDAGEYLENQPLAAGAVLFILNGWPPSFVLLVVVSPTVRCFASSGSFLVY